MYGLLRLKGEKMNKLKDIFYDKSDILVALLILIVAAGIIFWRLTAIMDYPEKLASENNSHIVTDVDISNQQQQDEHSDEFSDEPIGQEENQGGEDPFAGVVPEGSTGENDEQSVEMGIWQDGRLTKTVTVEVSGSTAQLAINCLVDAKLFDSYREYELICEDLGYNPEQVYAGTFTFQTGSTKEIIVNKVNLGN